MTTADQHHSPDETPNGMMSHGGHSWMMIACCLPMIIVAVVLVATGIAGATFIFAALMCTAMMWMMMRAMGHTDDS